MKTQETLIDYQKESVINMLVSTIEQDPTSIEFSEKLSPKKYKSINSGNKLGKSLAQRNVQWKILIFDSYTKEILTPLLKVGDLRGLGVTLSMNIKEKREPITDAPALYFIQPTKENIDIICRDCKNNLYDSIYLNFSSSIPRELLEDLASQLVKSNSTSKISKVYDQFLNFICIEPNFFHLGIPRSFYSLQSPKLTEDLILKNLDPIVNGITSVILTTGVIPVIACKVGGAAEMVSKKVEQKIRNLLLDRSHLHNFQMEQNKNRRRPVLIIVDRTVDMGISIQHRWTYRALVHDLLNMRMNEVKVPLKKEGEDKPTKYRNYEIEFDDEFWQENAGLQFQDVAEKLTASVNRYKEKLAEFNKRTGLNINEDEMLKGMDDRIRTGSESKLSKNVIEEVMKLVEEKKRLEMHNNISKAIFNEITSRKLDEFVAMEESLLEQNPLDKEVLLSLFREKSKGTFYDKLRLLLICYICKMSFEHPNNLTKQEFEEFENNLKQERDFGYIPELEFLRKYFMAYSTTKRMENTFKSNDSVFGGLSGSINRLKIFGMSIASGLSNYGTDDLPLTKIVNAIMDQRKIPDVEQYIYIDPKSSNTKVSYQKLQSSDEKFKEAIVFVIGGGNYAEYQNLIDSTKKGFGKQITYGSTNVVTGEEFLSELCSIGEEMKS